MVRMIFIGSGLVLMAVSAVILYSGLIVASREDDEPEKMQKWKSDEEKECHTDGNGSTEIFCR